RVLVNCYNSEALNITSLLRCTELGARIIVHEMAEVKRLESSGVHGIAYVPHGVLYVRPSPAVLARRRFGWKESAPVIGTFGLPRQGLLELIEAFSMVREIYSESSLVAIIRSDSSEESQSYLSQCLSLLAHKRLDRDDYVKFEAGVREPAYAVNQLQNCGLLVFPHHGSDDKTIDSLNVAMALRKPVIASRGFREIAAYTYGIDTPQPSVLAVAICSVMTNPEMYDELESSASEYAEERNWSRVAGA